MIQKNSLQGGLNVIEENPLEENKASMVDLK